MTAREKRLDIAMLLGTATAILISMFAGFARECSEAAESTFRLHILANSDNEADQKAKYALRDSILPDLAQLFSSAHSKDETRAIAERSLPYIEQRANEYLRTSGSSLTASVTVVNEEFPTRVYADRTLPAGQYDALRIVIGEGRGRNWWCVLYPSVCLSAASVPTSVLPRRELYERRKAAAKATADSLKAERGQIEFRFALYDFFYSLFFKDKS